MLQPCCVSPELLTRKEKLLSSFPKWKPNPTIKSSSYRSKIVRWKEKFEGCSVIHGGLSLKADPVIEGMAHTLNSKFRTKQVSNVTLNSKSKLPNSLKSEIGINWLKSFNKLEENKLRSLNTYYSHYVLGKPKYLNLRKANKQTKAVEDDCTPEKCIPVLISFINVGERIPNCAKQFLLFGTDLDENYGIVTIFLEKLVCDLDLVTIQEILLKRRCFDYQIALKI